MAAVKLYKNGKIQKLAATGFSNLQKNGKVILQLNNEADIFLSVSGNILNATIAGETGKNTFTFENKNQ